MQEVTSMPETRPYIPWDFIHDFMKEAFMLEGIPEADAEICTDVLMESDRRGIESHGCNRFKPIYIDRIEQGILNPVTNIEVLKETPTTLVYDAHDGMGMVASHRMMTELIKKAKKYGMAMGAIRNSSHYGIAGYWASMAINAGMIGVTGTNARPSIAPTFGAEPLLGTNPLTIGFPTDEPFPFLIDCATSMVQRGKIEYWAREGKSTPEGLVIGSDGNYMTDSNEILKALVKGEASLAPIGKYKGYGYATVIEVLSAALAQGNYMKMLSGLNPDGSRKPYSLGHFFMVFDPESMMGLEPFKKTAGEIMRALRSSKRLDPDQPIYTAGEKEYLAWQERKDKGVPVSETLQKEFAAVRDRLHMTGYVFPFEK